MSAQHSQQGGIEWDSFKPVGPGAASSSTSADNCLNNQNQPRALQLLCPCKLCAQIINLWLQNI